MKMVRKGLSDIIATVLIILLAIAAVAIVWAFISGSITSTASQVGINNALTSATFSLQSVVPNGAQYNVVVQRGSGSSPDSTFSYYPILSFETSTGTQTVNLKDDPSCGDLEEFATCTYTTVAADLNGGSLIRVRVYVAVTDGENVLNTNEPTDTELVGSGGGTPTCFDGVQNQGETGVDCGGPCSACGSPPVCGNGVIEAGEQCDDGNQVSTDGCRNSTAVAGPCTIPNGWVCDNQAPTVPNTFGCTNCVNSCGNGVFNPICGEECEDGNFDATDSCDVTNENSFGFCSLTFCGDGVRQTDNGENTGGPLNDGNEECDGSDFGTATCDSVGPSPPYLGSLGCTSSCTFDISGC